jgi:hypothetical protein
MAFNGANNARYENVLMVERERERERERDIIFTRSLAIKLQVI